MEKDTGNHFEHCFASAFIDGLLVYTFINEGNRIYKGTIIKNITNCYRKYFVSCSSVLGRKSAVQLKIPLF